MLQNEARNGSMGPLFTGTRVRVVLLAPEAKKDPGEPRISPKLLASIAFCGSGGYEKRGGGTEEACL